MDFFDLYDDNDCMGNCGACPYAIWVYPYDDEPYPHDCKIKENR